MTCLTCLDLLFPTVSHLTGAGLVRNIRPPDVFDADVWSRQSGRLFGFFWRDGRLASEYGKDPRSIV